MLMPRGRGWPVRCRWQYMSCPPTTRCEPKFRSTVLGAMGALGRARDKRVAFTVDLFAAMKAETHGDIDGRWVRARTCAWECRGAHRSHLTRGPARGPCGSSGAPLILGATC